MTRQRIGEVLKLLGISLRIREVCRRHRLKFDRVVVKIRSGEPLLPGRSWPSKFEQKVRVNGRYGIFGLTRPS